MSPLIPHTLTEELARDLSTLPGHPAAYLGDGCVARTDGVLGALDAARVLVVHGRGSFALCGAARVVAGWAGRRTVRHFDAFGVNPRIEDITAGVRAAREFRPDVVVGIGGGSALDAAKSVAVLAAQDAAPADCLARPEYVAAPRRCALVLLPTTSGSGSEMTRFAAIYAQGRKHSLDHPQLRSDLVLVDPGLAASVPPRTAVAAALDALCQAVESAWAVRATEESRRLAHDALARLLPVVGRAAGDSFGGRILAVPERRAALAYGAALAGAAIDITRTTAAHALSYGLTARLGLPHGAAVALHLSWLIGHHTRVTADDCRHPGGPDALLGIIDDIQKLSHETTARPVEALVTRLLHDGGYPTTLASLALNAGDWRAPVTEALASSRAANTPAPSPTPMCSVCSPDQKGVATAWLPTRCFTPTLPTSPKKCSTRPAP